jgi:hypothetical protein
MEPRFAGEAAAALCSSTRQFAKLKLNGGLPKMKRLLIVVVALLAGPLRLALLSLVIALGLYTGIRVARGQPRTPTSYTLPPDIGTQWKPGLTYNNLFPNWTVSRTVTCQNNSGDLQLIQGAVNAGHAGSPNGTVIFINGGICDLESGTVTLPSNTILRGNGPQAPYQSGGGTLLTIPPGTPVSDCKQPHGIGCADGSYCVGSHNAPLIAQQTTSSYGTSVLLSADAHHRNGDGSLNSSVTVLDASSFSVNQYVLLDETSASDWRLDPEQMGGASGRILASQDLRVVWQERTNQQRCSSNADCTTLPWISCSPPIGMCALSTDTLNHSTPNDPVAFPCAANCGPPSYATTGNGNDAASWFSRQDRPQNEIKQISRISGNTITFNTPIHIDYRSGPPHQAQLTPINNMQTFIGIESLAVSYGDGENAGGNIGFSGCANCWVKNVDSSHWLGHGIELATTYQAEIRDSYLHDGCWPVPGGSGYAMSMSFGASENLIENNISLITNKNMVGESAGTASVIDYNYFDDAIISDWGGVGNHAWIENHANSSHMVGSHHVLFEGNYSTNFDSDHTHGNSTYHTTYRNYFKGWRAAYRDPCTVHNSCPTPAPPDPVDDSQQSNGPVRTHGPSAYGYWFASVGNILGIPTTSIGWTYSDTNNNLMVNGTKDIYALGWEDFQTSFGAYCPIQTGGSQHACVDPNVSGTWSQGGKMILRDADYEYATPGIHWDTCPPPYTSCLQLPSSMITGLNGQPPFFHCGNHNFNWPPWDPTAPAATCPTQPGSNCLPAKARFDANAPFTCQ